MTAPMRCPYCEGTVTPGWPRMNRTVTPLAVRRILAQSARVPAQLLPGGLTVPAHPAYAITLELADSDTVTFTGDSFAELEALLRQLQFGLVAIDPADRLAAERFEPSWPVALLDYDHPGHPRGGDRR